MALNIKAIFVQLDSPFVRGQLGDSLRVVSNSVSTEVGAELFSSDKGTKRFKNFKSKQDMQKLVKKQLNLL